ncbi:MAG: Mur ligase domain-containing protein, partial [Candidatus Delongbacteria bacterium]|nr:Mur ligase domain-containing protein [Candidatus Delongbacteria bacterium]
MNIHFISIGGAVMHNLAIALKNKGYQISGSDDEIFEPSKSRLKAHGISPDHPGWDPDNITKDLDAVILGMHAREDNPELIRAMQLGINIYSFPEFLYEQTKHKKRLVIAGSHGKTTITSMVMHVLKKQHMNFDYMVGAQIEGFDTMVGLSDDTDIAIFEGDEYLSSPLDKKPKFLWYKPHAAVITGVAWDHANVFPTEKTYIDQFKTFINSIPDGGKLFFYKNDCIHKTISYSNPDI